VSLPSGLAAQLGVAEEIYVNEVQSVSGTPSAVFSLIFDGAQTPLGGLATNASAAAIQAALEALPNIGTGGVVCAGGPLPTAVSVTFSGPLVSKRNVPMLIAQTGITGLTISATTPGTGYGDPVTVDHFSEFLDESLKMDVPRITGQGLRAGNTTQRSDRTFSNKKGGGGPVNFEVADRGFGLHWKYALGSSVITTPAGGTLARDHTYTIDPNGQLGKSLTVQKGVPDVNGTVRPFTFKGSKVMAWQLSQAVDEWLKLQLTYDCLDADTVIGLAAAAYPTGQAIFHYDQCQAQVAGANVDLKGLSVGGNRNLKTDRYFVRPSTLKKEPLPNGFYEVAGSFDAEFTDMAAYNRFLSGALVPIVLTWTGAIIEAALAFSLIVTMPNCRFDGDTPDVGGPDLVDYSLPFVALNDGVSQPITIVARNTDTTD
jgi:hypothetical protein